MAKFIQLSKAEKEEIRRLTQFANRRIKAAQKAYAKEGIMTLPREVVGDIQLKEDWNTKNTPLSRSVKFESRQEYLERMRFLRSFEQRRPTITQYAKQQADRTITAVENSLGVQAPESLKTQLSKMTAPQLSKFWNNFSQNASKKGFAYSSESVMQQTLQEFFPEDKQKLLIL